MVHYVNVLKSSTFTDCPHLPKLVYFLSYVRTKCIQLEKSDLEIFESTLNEISRKFIFKQGVTFCGVQTWLKSPPPPMGRLQKYMILSKQTKTLTSVHVGN